MQYLSSEFFQGQLELSYCSASMAFTTITIPLHNKYTLSNIWSDIPETITYINVVGLENCSIPCLPSMARFTMLLAIRFSNLSCMKSIPYLGESLITSCKIEWCGIESLKNVPPTVRYITLQSNVYLELEVIPEGVLYMELIDQRMEVLKLPSTIEICEMTNCHISRLVNIPLSFMDPIADDPGDRYILDMAKCTSPYQEQIDALFLANYLPLESRPMNIQELFTSSQSHIVNTINQPIETELDLVYGAYLLQTSVLNHAKTNPNNPIEQAMGLGSNYPRRITEFIVSDMTYKYT